MARQKSTAAQLLNLYSGRVDPQDAAARFAERDARMAADTRTDAQRWLNDPPPDRSALVTRATGAPQRGTPKRINPTRFG